MKNSGKKTQKSGNKLHPEYCGMFYPGSTHLVLLIFSLFCFRGLYDQLMAEGKTETNDPRRLVILKCRIYQLERQCQSLSQQMNERKISLQHAYNTIENVAIDLEQRSGREGGLDGVVKTLRGVCKTFNRPTENSDVCLSISFLHAM